MIGFLAIVSIITGTVLWFRFEIRTAWAWFQSSGRATGRRR